jgi:hypothetical protein
MSPVASDAASRIEESGVDPSTAGGAISAATIASGPIRGFLHRNTRTEEIALFVDLSTSTTLLNPQ